MAFIRPKVGDVLSLDTNHLYFNFPDDLFTYNDFSNFVFQTEDYRLVAKTNETTNSVVIEKTSSGFVYKTLFEQEISTGKVTVKRTGSDWPSSSIQTLSSVNLVGKLGSCIWIDDGDRGLSATSLMLASDNQVRHMWIGDEQVSVAYLGNERVFADADVRREVEDLDILANKRVFLDTTFQPEFTHSWSGMFADVASSSGGFHLQVGYNLEPTDSAMLNWDETFQLRLIGPVVRSENYTKTLWERKVNWTTDSSQSTWTKNSEEDVSKVDNLDLPSDFGVALGDSWGAFLKVQPSCIWKANPIPQDLQIGMPIKNMILVSSFPETFDMTDEQASNDTYSKLFSSNTIDYMYATCYASKMNVAGFNTLQVNAGFDGPGMSILFQKDYGTGEVITEKYSVIGYVYSAYQNNFTIASVNSSCVYRQYVKCVWDWGY